MLNGIDLDGLQQYIALITDKPTEGISSYGIAAIWQGGVKTEVTTHNQKIGSQEIVKDFTFSMGEPKELLGDNNCPTPQDFLLGGLAGCMMVGFVVGASQKGIKLEGVKLRIEGDLNLRGFLNVDKQAPIGFKELRFKFEVTGNGTQSDYDGIIRNVQHFSLNYRTITENLKESIEKKNVL